MNRTTENGGRVNAASESPAGSSAGTGLRCGEGMSSQETSKRWRVHWKHVPPPYWGDVPAERGVADVEAPDRDWACVEAKKAAHRSNGVNAASVEIVTIEELP